MNSEHSSKSNTQNKQKVPKTVSIAPGVTTFFYKIQMTQKVWYSTAQNQPAALKEKIRVFFVAKNLKNLLSITKEKTAKNICSQLILKEQIKLLKNS